MSVLVILEQHRMAAQAVAAGRSFAESLGAPLEIAYPAHAGLTPPGAAKVYAVGHELLKAYTADGYTAAFEALVRHANPTLVVFAHTYQTRDYVPKLATRFGKVLISYTIAARAESGSLVFVRQLFQGKLNADVRLTGDGPHFVSIQAGAWPPADSGAAEPEPETFIPPLDAAAIRQKPEAPFRESARAVDLSAAERIVSVGRGIGEKEKIAVVEELARALNAELAASRPICDAGWLPMERQVGSSGQTVSPKLYLAVGISGAIQHVVGMKGAKTIVAINKDANAPIFEIADYGIAGDLFEVVPALIAEIKKAQLS